MNKIDPNKQWFEILIVASGALMLAVSFLADTIGLGRQAGFGPKQTVLAILGSSMLLVAGVMLGARRRDWGPRIPTMAELRVYTQKQWRDILLVRHSREMRRVLITDTMALGSPFLLYLCILLVFQHSLQVNLGEVRVFPDTEGLSFLGSIAFAVSLVVSFALMHFIPGLPWAICFFHNEERDGLFDLLAKSFLLTLLSYLLLSEIFKAVSNYPLTRLSLLAIFFVTTFSGVAIAAQRGVNVWNTVFQKWNPRNSFFWATVIWIVVLFLVSKDKLVFEAYNGDGVELFYLTNALKRELLPTIIDSTWNIAITPPLNAFLRLPSLLLLGDTEFATRFPVLCCFFCLPFVLWQFCSILLGEKQQLSLPSSLLILTTLFIYCTYVTWAARNPKPEPAELSFLCHGHFVVFAFLALGYFLTKRTALFVAFGTLAAFVRWHDFGYFLLPPICLYALFYRVSLRPLAYLVAVICSLLSALLVVVYIRGDLAYNIGVWSYEFGERLNETGTMWDLRTVVGLIDIPWRAIFYLTGGLLIVPIFFRRRRLELDIVFAVSFLVPLLVLSLIVPKLPEHRLHYLSAILMLPLCASVVYLASSPKGFARTAIISCAFVANAYSFGVLYSWKQELSSLRASAQETLVDVNNLDQFAKSGDFRDVHAVMERKGLLPDYLAFDVLWFHYVDKGNKLKPSHNVIISEKPRTEKGFSLTEVVEGRYLLYLRTQIDPTKSIERAVGS